MFLFLLPLLKEKGCFRRRYVKREGGRKKKRSGTCVSFVFGLKKNE
jgi:hypothetical protein